MKKYRLILIDTLILCLVSTLLAYAFNATATALKGTTKEDDPIVTAIIQANSGEVERLVKEGAGVAKTDDLGRTALMRAAFANYAGTEILRETDAKRVVMVELLVKHGAQLDTLDHDGWSALMWASWSGLHQVASKLLELGASYQFADKQGNTALIIAAQRGNAAIVRALLAKGADKTAANKSGTTALAAAKAGMEQYRAKASAYEEVLAALR